MTHMYSPSKLVEINLLIRYSGQIHPGLIKVSRCFRVPGHNYTGMVSEIVYALFTGRYFPLQLKISLRYDILKATQLAPACLNCLINM